jgi:hypothetical protein
MIDQDRAKLQLAAVVGAVLGIVTGSLAGSGWFIVFIWALIGAVVVSGLFGSECRPSLPAALVRRGAAFKVCDSTGQALAYVYFEDEPGRRSAAKLLTKDEARRITSERSYAGLVIDV